METEEGAKFLEETFPNWFKDLDMKNLEKMMEEMAGAPREELGKRQPGERQAREIYSESRMGSEVYAGLREKE